MSLLHPSEQVPVPAPIVVMIVSVVEVILLRDDRFTTPHNLRRQYLPGIERGSNRLFYKFAASILPSTAIFAVRPVVTVRILRAWSAIVAVPVAHDRTPLPFPKRESFV